MKFTQIDPAEINLCDERFRISFFYTGTELKESIQEVGLLNPPVLAHREGQLILVNGWKRVLACLHLELPLIPIFIAGQEDDLELFTASVYENVSVRSLSGIEKAEILARLKKFGSPDATLVRRFFPLLGIPCNPDYLRLFSVLAEFSAEEKKCVHQKNMSMPVLQALVFFNAQERELFLPWLQAFGQNKQKELLNLLREISQRDKQPVLDILHEPQIQELVYNDKLSLPQKAEKILSCLREARNPSLSFWTRTFEAVLKKLEIEKGILVDPSPFFEGEDLALHFSFKSREELLERLVQVKKLADRADFYELFKIPSQDE